MTVLIGPPDYRKTWEDVARPSWDAYGRRHGYDIVAIDGYLDASERGRGRSPNWQKLLIFEHPRVADYARVVWVDSDVLINPYQAPCIVSRCPPDRVGLVPTRAYGERLHLKLRMGRSIEDATADTYRRAGLSEDVKDWANTGVMALSPAHATVLRHVYDSFEETPHTAKEELPLSHVLFGRDLVAPLDPRFNWPWTYRIVEHYPFLLFDEFRTDSKVAALCVNAAWANAWFLHFTNDQPSTRHHMRLVVQGPRQRDAYTAIARAFAR